MFDGCLADVQRKFAFPHLRVHVSMQLSFR